MKTITLCLLTFITINIYAQKKEFIRIYNLNGGKITKCKNYIITDSTIECNKNGKIISYSQIGFIRTKRSFGHNVLVGSIIGFSTTAVFISTLNVQSFLFDKGTLVALSSIFVGAPVGSFIGLNSNFFKKSRRYYIGGDIENWGEFKKSFIN